MNTTNTERLTRCLAAAATSAFLGSVILSAHAQVLGPSPFFYSAGNARCVLIDPYYQAPSDAAAYAPGVFVGIFGVGNPTVYRLTPADASWGSFTADPVDNGLKDVMRLAHNPVDGLLYAVGRAPYDPAARKSFDVWKVRYSDDGGEHWFDDGPPFILAKSALSFATGITTDNAGNVYVTGWARDGRGLHWIIRRKVPGGAWTTIHKEKGQDVNMLPALCFFPGAEDKAAAVVAVGNPNYKWRVVRCEQRPDGSWPGSFTPVADTWPEATSTAYDAAYDSLSGNIYAVGCLGSNGRDPSSWLIRMSDDGGSTWKELLNAVGDGSWASGVAIDSRGKVTVSGVVNPTRSPTSGGMPVWKVIQCNDPESPESWSDNFVNTPPLFGGTTGSKGRGVACDAFGNVFTAGYMWNWTSDVTTPAPADASTLYVGLLRVVP